MPLAARIEGSERLVRKMDQAPQLVARGMNRAMEQAVSWLSRDAKLNAPVRSGRLRASITSRIETSGASLSGIVGSGVVYARIQELGGEIHPVRAQYLTVPLPAAQTAAGVTRGGARTFADTFVLRSRAGRLIIMQRTGRGVTPLFVLVRQVRLRPNPYLGPAMESNRPRFRELFGREVRVSLETG